MINTVDEFMDALGGTGAASEAFGVSGPAVSNWRAKGRLPAWAVPKAAQLALERGLALDPILLTTSKPRVNLEAAE